METESETALDATSQETDTEIAISSVNYCEVLTRLQRSPASLTPEELAGILSGVEVVPFERAGAEIAAQLNLLAPFISLGDRACLALASARKAAAWTTDKVLEPSQGGHSHPVFALIRKNLS